MKHLLFTIGLVFMSNVVFAGTLVYFYNGSKCADAWGTGENSTVQEKKSAISGYLTKNGINYDTIEIACVYGLGEDCESCACLSGDRYYVTAQDSYADTLSSLHFSLFNDSLQNPDNVLMSYYETQCSDPWYGTDLDAIPTTPQMRLNNLARYLTSTDIDFVSLEIKLTIDLTKVDLCSACNCRTGYRFDMVVNNQYTDKLKAIGFKDFSSSIEYAHNDFFTCYPNPTGGLLNFNMTVCEKGLKYMIFDTNGRQLQQGDITSAICLNLTEGIYLMVIYDQGKIVKQEKIVISNNHP